MNKDGSISFQGAINNINGNINVAFTSFAVNFATEEVYCSLGNADLNTIFVASFSDLITWSLYLSSPAPSSTFSYMVLSKDNSTLYQVYENTVYAALTATQAASLNSLTYTDLASAYAEPDSVYPNGLNVITGTSSYTSQTIVYNMVNGILSDTGNSAAVASSTPPFNQIFPPGPPPVVVPT
jgi:hypothetical protein